jgi:hypothetical protein
VLVVSIAEAFERGGGGAPLTAQARRLLDRFDELGVKPYD